MTPARALLPLLFALAACGPHASSPGAEAGGGSLVFRHGPFGGFEADFRTLLDRFEALHPGVHVVSETVPMDVGQQHQLYAINLEGGSDAFDVMGLDIIWIAEFARAGWIRDISDGWKAEERRAFLPSTVEAATWLGKPYAVPWFTDAALLYYRKDLLAKHRVEVPRTWEQLIAASKQVLEAEGDPRLTGFVWQGRQYEGLVCDALEYIHSNGTRLIDGQGRWAADTARAAGALALMRELVHKHKVSPMLVLAGDEETARQIFGNGQAVFMRNWPYANGIYSKPGSEVLGKVGLAPLPHFPGGESSPTLGGWFLAVNRHSKRPAAALELIRFLTSAEVQRELFRKLSYLPTRVALYRDAELLKAAPQLTFFGENLARARPRPVTPFYTSLSEIMQAEVSATLARLRTPEAAVRNIEVQMQPILAEAR